MLEQKPDEGYVVSVPFLPGCVSQGYSRDEALTNIRDAIQLYIEDCSDGADTVPTETGREILDVEAVWPGVTQSVALLRP